MKTDRRAEEDSPQHVRNASEPEKGDADDHVRRPVPPRERDVNRVTREIGCVAREDVRRMMQPFAAQNPSGVRPPGALSWRVRITFTVGMLVVDTVGGDPEDRSALEGQGAAPG